MEHKPTIRVLEILEALAAENQGVSLTHLSEKNRHPERNDFSHPQNAG